MVIRKGSIVICTGGGIPTYYDEQHNLQGVEAVIDKDLCSALLAENIDVVKGKAGTRITKNAECITYYD